MSTAVAEAEVLPWVADIPDVSVYLQSTAAAAAARGGSNEPIPVVAGLLQVYDMSTGRGDDADPLAVVQLQFLLELDTWQYILSGQPVLRVEAGRYLLPNPADPASSSFLVTCAPETAPFVEDLLEVGCSVKDRVSGKMMVPRAPQDAPVAAPEDVKAAPTSTGPALASGVQWLGETAAAALVGTAGYVGSGIRWCVPRVGLLRICSCDFSDVLYACCRRRTGEKLKGATTPLEQQVVVGDRTKRVVSAVKGTVETAAFVSSTILGVVTTVAGSVGTFVSGLVRDSAVGKRALGLDEKEKGKPRVGVRATMVAVAASSVVAASE